MQNWRETWRPARLEEVLPDSRVRCHLSPRGCTMRDGQHGFCGVRANRDGRLVTMNYGKSVHSTVETIETEAVNHFAPGEPILSLGNVGCMLNCSYCHNWKTSQAKYVDDRDVFQYSPEGIIETALRHGIRVLSWTYNDPVVWHEFVRDTAMLAKQAGLINLYKSAFFISLEAIDELLPYIDIFSISIKSIDPDYYRKYTSGWLEPVLEGTKHVFRAGKHVEVSTLMITDISDDPDTARRVAEWVLTELDSTVPAHFVRFHPDYKMRNTTRTPVDRLERAREIAVGMGLEQVYLGNVYDTQWSNTFCRGCGKMLISRYGLNAAPVGLDERANCRACGRPSGVKLLPPRAAADNRTAMLPASCTSHQSFDWHGDIRSLHVQVRNDTISTAPICHRRRTATGASPWTVIQLAPGESYRFILAKSSPDEIGPDIVLPGGLPSNLHEVFDRAHFPTVALSSAAAAGDVSPFPLFEGRQSN
jgi:pyruvate formate lyase activating enzyme